MPLPRTDLAIEATQLLNPQQAGEIPGVTVTEDTVQGFPVTQVEIISSEGAEAVGKPQGRYLTLELGGLLRREAGAFPRAAQALARELGRLLPEGEGLPALVVGLGNRLVTPDAVGPRAADHTMVTRHLIQHSPEQFAPFRPVAALAAGVLGTTGVESGELIRAVTDRIQPGLVIAIDALAARSVHRLCSTVQLADTGIIPGSGVGNARAALNRETLGVPVIAIGVPTVVDAATLAADLTGQEAEGELGSLLVTPKDIDVLVSDVAKVIGYGVNLALQPGLTVEDVDLFLS
ncbi:MAG: GPR endopeptidase [Candidatus Onthomonas sp.]